MVEQRDAAQLARPNALIAEIIVCRPKRRRHYGGMNRCHVEKSYESSPPQRNIPQENGKKTSSICNHTGYRASMPHDAAQARFTGGCRVMTISQTWDLGSLGP